MTIHDVCDFIIVKVTEGGSGLSLLKLQKLLYYVQAWYLALIGRPLFAGRFQAWVHGPVNREVYDRFKKDKTLYSLVGAEDLRTDFDMGSIPPDVARFIDDVLEAYAGLTGTQLEEMTHNEDPWTEARKGYRPSQRCEVETRAPDQFYAAFSDLVLADGFQVSSLDSPDNNLEAVFRYLVQE